MMNENHQEERFAAILQALETIVTEIKGLRNDLAGGGHNALSTTSATSVETPNPPAIEPERQPAHHEAEEEEEEAFLNIFDWLALRNITVKNHKQQQKTDEIFDQLATFLGEKFESLTRLHDSIRRNLSSGSSFILNLSSSSQEEIANSTQFCTLLHQYAFLSSYRYNRYNKTIHATPQRVGKVINFFTGGWFERYIFLKVNALLEQSNLNHIHLINPRISLPNGDDFELDIVFSIENEPLWLECKTSDYQSYIKKYADIRPTLAVSKARSLLVVLGISDSLTANLTALYDITVVNENNFLSYVTSALETPVASPIVPNDTVTLPAPQPHSPPAPLSTLLNKANLRPLPELRPTILTLLVKIVSTLDMPKSLMDIKLLLAEQVNTSNSKLQDVLNAVIKSNCLLDDEGEVVDSFTTPFARLISNNADDLNHRCIESYVLAVLQLTPDYFDNGSNKAEFEQITGGKIPTVETIERLKGRQLNKIDKPLASTDLP